MHSPTLTAFPLPAAVPQAAGLVQQEGPLGTAGCVVGALAGAAMLSVMIQRVQVSLALPVLCVVWQTLGSMCCRVGPWLGMLIRRMRTRASGSVSRSRCARVCDHHCCADAAVPTPPGLRPSAVAGAEGAVLPGWLLLCPKGLDCVCCTWQLAPTLAPALSVWFPSRRRR